MSASEREPLEVAVDDRVLVEQLDGELETGVVVDILDDGADAVVLPIGGEPTVYEYWGHRPDPDETVVTVRHTIITDDGEHVPRGDSYSYPISQVTPVATDSTYSADVDRGEGVIPDGGKPVSDPDQGTELDCRKQALAGVRDALVAVQRVPAAGVDADKHDSLKGVADDLWSLERALQNEVEQQRGDHNVE